MSLFTRWIVVKCQKCSKTHCEATPGAKVRWKCQRCKTWQIIDV